MFLLQFVPVVFIAIATSLSSVIGVGGYVLLILYQASVVIASGAVLVFWFFDRPARWTTASWEFMSIALTFATSLLFVLAVIQDVIDDGGLFVIDF